MACFSQYILGNKLRYGYLLLVQLIPFFVVGQIPTGKLEGASICHGQHSDSEYSECDSLHNSANQAVLCNNQILPFVSPGYRDQKISIPNDVIPLEHWKAA